MPDQHPTVLLRHDLPDGSHHFDWLLARDPEGPLLTFRLDRDVAAEPTPSFAGQQLPDHRRLYLDYEGPISGDRGTVRSVARGRCEIIEASHAGLLVRVDLGRLVGYVRGNAQDTDRFLFEWRQNSCTNLDHFG